MNRRSGLVVAGLQPGGQIIKMLLRQANQGCKTLEVGLLTRSTA
jgi:hypothetical protein